MHLLFKTKPKIDKPKYILSRRTHHFPFIHLIFILFSILRHVHHATFSIRCSHAKLCASNQSARAIWPAKTSPNSPNIHHVERVSTASQFILFIHFNAQHYCNIYRIKYLYWFTKRVLYESGIATGDATRHSKNIFTTFNRHFFGWRKRVFPSRHIFSFESSSVQKGQKSEALAQHNEANLKTRFEEKHQHTETCVSLRRKISFQFFVCLFVVKVA